MAAYGRFAEMDKQVKNTISHRSKSLALVKAFLEEEAARAKQVGGSGAEEGKQDSK